MIIYSCLQSPPLQHINYLGLSYAAIKHSYITTIINYSIYTHISFIITHNPWRNKSTNHSTYNTINIKYNNFNSNLPTISSSCSKSSTMRPKLEYTKTKTSSTGKPSSNSTSIFSKASKDPEETAPNLSAKDC